MTSSKRDRRRSFDRRSFLVLGLNGCLLGVVANRLYQLQIVEHGQYVARSEENRVRLQLLKPERGRIFDRKGVLLAGNRWRHYLYASPPEEEEERREVFLQLTGVLQPSPRQRDKLRGLLRLSGGGSGVIRRPVRLESWEDVTRVMSHSVVLPGVSVRRESERYYPGGGMLAHLLGYVSSVTKDDIDRNGVLAHLTSYQIGRAGFEHAREDLLRGRIGTMWVETNARAKPVRNLRERKPEPGRDLRLTVDFRLQRRAAELLAGKTGAAVVLDAQRGEALACYSSPSFDPNLFVAGLDPDDWRTLSTDPGTPLVDRAVQGQYAPGSTFKVAVALAALESGHDPTSRVYCNGVREVGSNRFHCWKRRGHGSLDLLQAISQSCDVHFYDLALELGIDRIAAVARRLGLGAAVPVDHAASVPAGLMPSQDWKTARYGEAWSQGDTANIGIGQGYLLVTPLQLALMTARVASGRELSVRFARDLADGRQDTWLARAANPASPAGGGVANPLAVNDSSLALVREAMAAVVNDPRGTAYAARIEEEGFRMAGKTGTVQVRRITEQEREAGVRKNEEILREQRDHALFVGYAPVDTPRYAAAIVIEHGGSGSRVAAPIARDLMLTAQRLEGDDPAPPADPVA